MLRNLLLFSLVLFPHGVLMLWVALRLRSHVISWPRLLLAAFLASTLVAVENFASPFSLAWRPVVSFGALFLAMLLFLRIPWYEAAYLTPLLGLVSLMGNVLITYPIFTALGVPFMEATRNTVLYVFGSWVGQGFFLPLAGYLIWRQRRERPSKPPGPASAFPWEPR